MRFPPSFLDEIRQRVSVVDVVGRKVRLIKKGREHQGLCPFHNEKTPSFTVVEEKGFYHCFGCGAHGDAIRFLTDAEGLPFPEAVERLAAEAGLQMPEMTPADIAREEKRASLYDVMEAAASWFESQYKSMAGDTARAYIDGRGLSAGTVKKFRIGYAPDQRTALKQALLSRKITEDQMVEAGLLIKPDSGETYDRFRGRIMFPIADRAGRIIAFGGRAMNKDAKAKYLNSPETPLFHKGHNLYNFHLARKAAFDTGQIIVAEGYMDVIALSQAGFEAAVAPLGTALTEDQIQILWRMVPEPYLCFDGDKAGVRAAGRALDRALPLLKAGQSLQFALLPEGKDPDDLVRQKGPAAFQDVLDKAKPLAQMLWDTLAEGSAFDTPERKAGFEKAVFMKLAEIEDEQVKQYYQQDYRRRLNEVLKPQWQQASGAKGASGGGGWQRGGGQGNWKKGGRGKFSAQKGIQSSGQLGRTRLGQSDSTESLTIRLDEILVLTILHHPALLISHLDDFQGIVLSDSGLNMLRNEIVSLAIEKESLDSEMIRHHLLEMGHESLYIRLTRSDSHKPDWFAWPDADLQDAETGWLQVLNRQRRIHELMRQLKEAEIAVSRDLTEEGFERLKALKEELENAAGNESEIDGYGLASGRYMTT